jgi:hypothetical protein
MLREEASSSYSMNANPVSALVYIQGSVVNTVATGIRNSSTQYIELYFFTSEGNDRTTTLHEEYVMLQFLSKHAFEVLSVVMLCLRIT